MHFEAQGLTKRQNEVLVHRTTDPNVKPSLSVVDSTTSHAPSKNSFDSVRLRATSAADGVTGPGCLLATSFTTENIDILIERVCAGRPRDASTRYSVSHQHTLT